MISQEIFDEVENSLLFHAVYVKSDKKQFSAPAPDLYELIIWNIVIAFSVNFTSSILYDLSKSLLDKWKSGKLMKKQEIDSIKEKLTDESQEDTKNFDRLGAHTSISQILFVSGWPRNVAEEDADLILQVLKKATIKNSPNGDRMNRKETGFIPKEPDTTMSHEMEHYFFEKNEKYRLHYEIEGNEGILFEGGDGLSMDEAVIIHNALDTAIGIDAENYFISRKLGKINKDWFKLGQGLTGRNGRHIDVIKVRTKQKKEIKFYFDITDFFGKH